MENYIHLDRTFAALSDPTRRAMLSALERADELTVGDLAQPLTIKLPTVLKHLDVLIGAGLVTREKHGRTVRVRLAAEPLGQAADWLSRYERFWAPRLDRLARAAEAREAAAETPDPETPATGASK